MEVQHRFSIDVSRYEKNHGVSRTELIPVPWTGGHVADLSWFSFSASSSGSAMWLLDLLVPPLLAPVQWPPWPWPRKRGVAWPLMISLTVPAPFCFRPNYIQSICACTAGHSRCLRHYHLYSGLSLGSFQCILIVGGGSFQGVAMSGSIQDALNKRIDELLIILDHMIWKCTRETLAQACVPL